MSDSNHGALPLSHFRFADGRRVHRTMHTYFEREVAPFGRQGIDLFGLGAAYFDEPEPRLAILGPPAITRLMFELWLANPWLIPRFDLRNPRQRRDYALWLKEEGRSLGLDNGRSRRPSHSRVGGPLSVAARRHGLRRLGGQ